MRTHDAAGCVIFDKDMRVLLVRQTYGNKKWAMPGGIIETGEASWDAAVRECMEEIGVTISHPVLCGVYFLPHRHAHVFEFRVTGPPLTVKPDGKEIDRAEYFALDQLPKPMSSFTIQRIQDAAALSSQVALRNQHIDDYKVEPRSGKTG